MAADNISLGRFVLDGIPPAPRGVPRIEVTFDIDVNGILTVTAKDLGTGKDVSVKITAPHRLSKEEIDRMIKEAEMYAEQDRKKKEEAELRNEAESLVYTIEKALKDFGDKVPNNVKSRVEESLKKLKNALADKDVQEIKNKMEELKKVAQEMGTVIYQQSAQQSSNSSGSKTIDADYKVVNDNKKN
jgi:molecular chaperone DnaK